MLSAPVAFEADRVVLRDLAGGPTAASAAGAARDGGTLHGGGEARRPGMAPS